MVLPILVNPESITIVVSPLKRLRTRQVDELEERWGLKAVAINEDLVDRTGLWEVRNRGPVCFVRLVWLLVLICEMAKR
jgi:hypothetical protein